MDKETQRDLGLLMSGLKMYDTTGIFTSFLAALVDNGCPVEAIVKAFDKTYRKGAGQ